MGDFNKRGSVTEMSNLLGDSRANVSQDWWRQAPAPLVLLPAEGADPSHHCTVPNFDPDTFKTFPPKLQYMQPR